MIVSLFRKLLFVDFVVFFFVVAWNLFPLLQLIILVVLFQPYGRYDNLHIKVNAELPEQGNTAKNSFIMTTL